MSRGYTHTWHDTLALAFIAAALGLFSAYLASLVPPAVFRMDDNFFGSDINRVVGHMTDPAARRSRIWVHPLFLVLTLPLGLGLMKLSFSDLQACLMLVSASASLTGVFLYMACRNLGLAIRHAVVIVALFASSSAFMFWWSIPESFPFAGAALAFLYFLASKPAAVEPPKWSLLQTLSMLALLILAMIGLFTYLIPNGLEVALASLAVLSAIAAQKVPGAIAWIVAGVLSLGITMSNWAAALIATFLCRKLRDFVAITAITFLLSCALAVLQQRWIISTPIFYNSLKLSKSQGVQSELGPRKGLSTPVLEHISFFTMVFPKPSQRVETQVNKLVVHSPPNWKLFEGERGWLRGAWLGLLCLGLLGALRRGYRAFGLSLTGFIAFNWVLHSQYGDDIFLYATHFLIPLSLIPALAMTGKYRDVVCVMCAAFALAAFPVNLSTFRETAKLFQDFYPSAPAAAAVASPDAATQASAPAS